MASLFSTTSQIAAVNTRIRSGVLTLPLTSANLYRQIMIKDLYGAFPASTLTLSTQLGDTFEDGTTTRILCNAYEFQALYAGSTSRWHTVAGTQWTSMYVSSLRVDSLQLGSGDGWADFGPLRATAISSLQIYTGYLQTTSISTLGLSTGTLTACNISAVTMSTNYGFFSTISTGTVYGRHIGDGSLLTGLPAGGLTIIPPFLSTTTLSTNLLTASNISTNSISTNNLTVSNLYGNGIAFLLGLSVNTISTNQVNSASISNSGVISTLGLNVGSLSSINISALNLAAGFISTIVFGAQTAYITNLFVGTEDFGSALTASSNITQTGGTTTLAGLSVNTISTNQVNSGSISNSGLISTTGINVGSLSSINISTLNLTAGFISTLTLGARTAYITNLFVGTEDFGSALTASSNITQTAGTTVLTGLSVNTISTNFVVTCNISTNSISTNFGFFSTISANTIYGKHVGDGSLLTGITGSGGAGVTSTLSTLVFLTSSISTANITSQQGYISSLTVDYLAIGSNYGYVNMGDVIATSLSSIAIETQTITTGNLKVGVVSSLSYIAFPGLQQGYTQGIIAEQSTGTGLQELLIFRGSSASDRIRMQTTGSIVFEPGVGARIFPSAPSNATPAMIINTSSNVGIGIAAPTTLLDVAGTGRFQMLSTQQIFVSSISSGSIFGRHIGDGSLLTGLPAGGLSALPPFLSTTTLSTNLLTASNISTNSISTNNLTVSNLFGNGIAVLLGLSVNTISTNQVNSASISNSGVISTLGLNVGSLSSINISTVNLAAGFISTIVLGARTAYITNLFVGTEDFGSALTASSNITQTGGTTTLAGLSVNTISTNQINSSNICNAGWFSNAGNLSNGGSATFSGILNMNNNSISNVSSSIFFQGGGFIKDYTPSIHLFDIDGNNCTQTRLINGIANIVLTTTDSYFGGDSMNMLGNLNVTASGKTLNMSNNNIILKDNNHGLVYGDGSYRNVDIDGPFLYGYSAGALGVTDGGDSIKLSWDRTTVNINTSTINLRGTANSAVRIGPSQYQGTAADTTTYGLERSRHELRFAGYRDAQIDKIGSKIVNINKQTYGNSGLRQLIQSADLAFFTVPPDTADIDNTVERMRITDSGTVGIGVTAPTVTLDVAGAGRFTAVSTNIISTNTILANNISTGSLAAYEGFFSTFGTELGFSQEAYFSTIFTENIIGQKAYLSSLNVNSILNADTAFIIMGDVLANSLSTNMLNSSNISNVGNLSNGGSATFFSNGTTAASPSTTNAYPYASFTINSASTNTLTPVTPLLLMTGGYGGSIAGGLTQSVGPVLTLGTIDTGAGGGTKEGYRLTGSNSAFYGNVNMQGNNISNVGEYLRFSTGSYMYSAMQGGFTNAFLDIVGTGGDGQLRLINGTSEIALRANSDLGIIPASGYSIVLNGPITANYNLNMNNSNISNVNFIRTTALSTNTISTNQMNSSNICNAGFISNNGVLSNTTAGAFFQNTSNTGTLGIAGIITATSNIIQTAGTTTLAGLSVNTLSTNQINSSNICNAGWLSNGGILSNTTAAAFFQATSNTTTLGVAQTATFASNITQSAGTTTLAGLSVNTISTNTITTSNIRVGTISTNSFVSYPGLAQQYTQSILAEQGTGAGLQEMLIFRGSSASDRIRLQTTGSIVFETGVGARVYPTITSNATPSWMIDINGCVGVGLIPSGTTSRLDVAGQGRFQNLSTTSIQAGSMNLSVAFV